MPERASENGPARLKGTTDDSVGASWALSFGFAGRRSKNSSSESWLDLEQETQSPGRESSAVEIRYDRAVVEDFVTRLPEALRVDVRLGREFLRETVQYVRVTDGGERRRTCPICRKTLGKITPQPPSAARCGSSRRRLQVSRARVYQRGLLNTGKVFGLVVAGAGFEPATFAASAPKMLMAGRDRP